MLRSKADTRMIAGSLNRLNRNGRTASSESGPPRLNRTIAVRLMRPAHASGLRTPYRHGRAWHTAVRHEKCRQFDSAFRAGLILFGRHSADTKRRGPVTQVLLSLLEPRLDGKRSEKQPCKFPAGQPCAWHDHPRVCLLPLGIAHRNSWMVGPSPTMRRERWTADRSASIRVEHFVGVRAPEIVPPKPALVALDLHAA